MPDPLSNAAVRIELLFRDEAIATGSGVLIQDGTEIYLATAGHNLTGRDENGDCSSTTGLTPDKAKIRGFCVNVVVDLLSDPSNGMSYRFHAFDQRIADIALIQLPIAAHEVQVALQTSFFEAPERDDRFHVGQDCFIIGYPLNLVHLADSNYLPIWKFGHIASEPAYPFDGKPHTLIDATTRGGMSGAPVFMKRRNALDRHHLLGLYVGRINMNSGGDSAIGIVVRSGVVHELLVNRPNPNERARPSFLQHP